MTGLSPSTRSHSFSRPRGVSTCWFVPRLSTAGPRRSAECSRSRTPAVFGRCAGRTRAGFTVVADSEVASVLPGTDVLIATLPGLKSNRGLIAKGVLALLPRHAWIVDVGRGSTVDEDALLAAVQGKTLGRAAFDVFATEPLPADSPLWDEENIIISPHAAGGRPIGAAELVSENLRRLSTGDQLLNLVTRA
jgi:phosphoglycerate dehydrogenase-like enzyme